MNALHFVVSLCLSSLLVHVVVEAATPPDVISLGLDRIGSVGAQLSWNDATAETYVVSYCELPQCNSYVQSPSLTTTSYTLTGLRSLSNYSVFVIATNANGSTDGNIMNLTTLLENALYFMDKSENLKKKYFASGSIFRGPNTYVSFPISQFYCEPDSSSDTIEWYTPNGDLIAEGLHTINAGTGESTLSLGNYVTTENEGRNFTCRINSSGFIQDHYFGLYYLLPGVVTTSHYIGDRIYTKSNPPIVREFVLQRGSFDIETDELYDIQAIYPPTANNWMFNPALTQPNPPDDSIGFLTNVQFNSSAICQLGTSQFQGYFFCISNKSFILKTTPRSGTSGILFSQGSCIENNSTAYVYTIGEGVDIGVTCPLFYNASFLDTSDLIQLDYLLNRNNPRRLWVNSTATFAMVKHDREYVCEDKYGTRASFKARVDASTPIEVFGNDSTITPTSNDTMYIVNEVTLYCLSDSDSNGVVWYSDTNANSTLPRTYTQVSDSVTAQPHVSNPRSGRSDLVVRSDPTSYLEGYFYCEDSMDRVMFYTIFTQQPIAPIAQINPNVATLQIYIGVDSPNITCGYSNLAHPAPLSYWEGTVTNTIYANQLIATDSGNYTCISANVVGYTSTTILILVPPRLVNSTQPEDLGDIFVTDYFRLSCQFETSLILTPSISIQWYHNNTLNTIFPNTTNTNGNTVTSTLTVTASSLSQAGDYHCVATIGASSPTNSTPISVIINPITLPNAIPVMITNSELRNATISWTPSIQFPSLTETYTLVYQRVGDSFYQTINALNSTSYTLTGLLFNSQYRVYVNATNRFGTTQGPDTTFSTDQVRLYFMRDGEVVQFASGSIFRGGIHSIIIEGVFEFYCVPDSLDQEITWYAPNGDVIPVDAQSSGLYHIRNANTGESVLYTNNGITSNIEGNNFTCSFTPSSGSAIESYFGIYYVGQDNDDVFGIRLYGPGNLIYEFVYQAGTFSIDLASKYDIECLDPSNQIIQWEFEPNLVTENTTNTFITQAQFNPNATCQYISCNPSVQYPVFSDKPFFLQTDVTGAQPNCRPNDHLYEFSLGTPIELYITCPLIFGSRFLDVSQFSQIQNEFTVDTSRRLFFNTTTLPTLALERNFVCEDTYGDSVSFSIRILANETIQLLDSDNSDTPIANGTDLIGVDIPNIIHCITQSNENSASWLVDSNPNRTQNEPSIPVSTNTAAFPYVTDPRVGRSNLILNGTIGSGKEGFYTCDTNPGITVGIFSQNPVSPTATISPGQTVMQVVIGTNTPVLNCGHSNSAHPLPIYFWTGSISSSTATLDTNLFLETNSGEYTCTASNVEGLSTDTVTITVIPPPPQFNSIQLVTTESIFITDSFELSCQFETFTNVTNTFSIQWYHNSLNAISSTTTNTNGNTATSTLTVTALSLSQAGDYHCVATVGASSPTNSNTTLVSINPITLPNAINVTITDSELRNATISWTPSIQFPSLTETYTLVYQRVGDSSYQTINALNSTSFTLTGLLFNSQYRVYVNATNRFGTTQGPDTTFSTDQVTRLYFMRDGERVQFASGSIFRGGTHNIIIEGVFQFYCVPDSPDQVITWYAPNGDVIPAGPQSLGLYHIRDNNTGESALYTNNAIASSNEGNNFTCSFIPSSGTAIESYFGIYYVGQDNDDIFGVRLYGPGNAIYEFVYQAGTFSIDLASKYDIECLNPSNQIIQWEFEPNLVSENTTNTLITQAQFNPNATCQYISCNPSVQYPVFSDKPFFLQTDVTGAQPNCRPNDHLYEFSLGTPIELYITCPLIFGSRFLDVSEFSQIQNEFTVDTSRRLFFNTTTLPTLALERNFVCEDTYGDSVSFSIRILASEAIQLLGSEDSDTPIANGTDLIGVAIPSIIYCITQSNENSANWLVDANPNRNQNEPSIPVSNNTAAFPYVTNPRVGRSNLILNGTIESENEGFYTCVTNPGITVGIFSQNPVPPTATISPVQTVIQVVIGTNTPVLNCEHSNSPHPLPIYFWTGSISSSTATLDTNIFLESNSGEYTCTASNVVGLSTDTVTITVIPPPPQFNSIRFVTTENIFITDSFVLSCQFETFPNVTTMFSIQWYHNTLNAISSATTNTNGNTATSTLTVTASSLSQAGDYHCVATVGASSPTNSTPISVIINPITLPNAINVTITNSELRNATIIWTPSIQFPSLTETYTLVYQRVGDSSYQTINTSNSTSFPLTGLLFNNQYRVYVNATNRFGTTQGPDTTFSTDEVRLYFMRDGEIVQFASGSIFRGGTHSIIIRGVFEFYCVPDSPDQVITWYAPNGDEIPAGPQSLGLYHIRDNNTGESVLYTNNAIGSSNEGNNYRCNINPSSGSPIESYFGIYYVWLVLGIYDIFGVRLYGPDKVIYEFVYQIGTIDLNFSANYDIECLNPSNQASQWEFEPNLVSENGITNKFITQAQFNPNATCQYISCNPSVQYPVFSDKPFFLQTNVTVGQPNCRPNNHVFEFNLGSPIELYITCPLIFSSRFLDISDIDVIQNDFTVDTSRRLFFNATTNLATLNYERDYICEDRYGGRVSFSIQVLANDVIELFAGDNSNITNGTQLIAADIPNSISCITQTSGNSANWLVDSNPNRSLNGQPTPVSTNTTAFPYVTNPRVGRSNLILNGTIGNGSEGFYTCVTNPGITVGIFSQNPVPPTATISPVQTMIQVVIGTNTPVLNCEHSNSPHPLPIYFWTGSISSSTATLDTNLLLESNSGEYTCTASNVVGLSTDTVTITVIPPPPQFVRIQSLPQPNIYINDTVMLQCQFSTFPNVTSPFEIVWYKDGVVVPNTGNITMTPRDGSGEVTSALTLPNSKINNEGDYSCQATVGASQSSVSENLTLKFDPLPTPIHLQLISTPQTPYFTQDTQLQCNFSTEARFQSLLMIYWYHNNNTVMDGDGIQITRINVGTMEVASTLTLNNISYIRAGDYHCAGRVEGQLSSDQINSTLFTVTVLNPPAPSLVGNIYVTKEVIFLSDTFSISCQFMTLEHFFQALKISWSHNGTLLQNSPATEINTVNIGNTNINSSLTITDAQMVQSGIYTCSGNVLSSIISTGNITIMISAPPLTTQSTTSLTTQSTTSLTTQSTTSLTTQPIPVESDYVPIIAGALIAILFIIVVILVVLLILIIICRSRTKKRAKENLPDILLRRDKRKRTRSTASEKQLVTPTASLGLDITYIHDNKNFQEDTPATTTFRGSGYQETGLNGAEPLYEDFAFEKYNIPLAIFPQKVLEYHLANNAEFDRQYSTFRKTFIHDVSTGSHINNKPKNRFANIIPYEHSRVRLTFTGEHSSDYINACYVDGYHRKQTYIASQGPMPHTLIDFWRMIWEKNIDHIVALTKVMEAAKRKCEQYWPENETDMCEFDMIQVTLKKCERYTSYDIRMMEITHAEYSEARTVIQFHYTVWPDHGVPIFSSSLISFINHTKEYNDPKTARTPMLVHCSAGVGRTGTFIVLDYFMEHLKEDIDKINIYRLVAQLRENRCLMVQTKDQYIFIHDALLDIICCKDTFIADHEFQAYLDSAMIRSLESMSTPFEDQYELIMKTSRIVDERDIAEASDVANIMKNRFPNFVPFDSHRVTVIPDQDGDKDYINASFVHSYQKHKGFIAAQGPLEHTIYDFWKMVTKYRIQIILMLSDLSEGGHEMCAKYWPEEGQEMMVQYLIITCEKEEVFDEYIRRKLVVSTQQVDYYFKVLLVYDLISIRKLHIRRH